jgi:hypothetical protein
VAFLADDPQNGTARGSQQAPCPLHTQGVDSVLGVAEPDPGLPAGGEDLVPCGKGAAEHLFAWGRGRREAARNRLLDDHVLAGPRRFDGQRRVERRRHAEVDHVHVGRGEHLLGESSCPLRPRAVTRVSATSTPPIL